MGVTDGRWLPFQPPLLLVVRPPAASSQPWRPPRRPPERCGRVPGVPRRARAPGACPPLSSARCWARLCSSCPACPGACERAGAHGLLESGVRAAGRGASHPPFCVSLCTVPPASYPTLLPPPRGQQGRQAPPAVCGGALPGEPRLAARQSSRHSGGGSGRCLAPTQRPRPAEPRQPEGWLWRRQGGQHDSAEAHERRAGGCGGSGGGGGWAGGWRGMLRCGRQSLRPSSTRSWQQLSRECRQAGRRLGTRLGPAPTRRCLAQRGGSRVWCSAQRQPRAGAPCEGTTGRSQRTSGGKLLRGQTGVGDMPALRE